MAVEDPCSRFAPVISLLAHNRRIAGGPSYQTIEDISKELGTAQRPVRGILVCRVPHSTAHNLFKKSCQRIPRWELLESLWATLYRHAELKGRETDTMFSLADLERCYREAETAPADAVEQSQRSAQPVTTTVGDRYGRPSTAELMGPLDWEICLNTAQPAGDVAEVDVPAGGCRLREVNGQFVAELQERSRRAPWRIYQDVVPDWSELYVIAEAELAEIRTYAPLRIPGLLQTGEYTRLFIARDLPNIPEAELRRRVEFWLCRQDILYRPDAPKLWVILHERVLREDAGSPPVLRAQIRHLIGLAGRTNLTLQVMPVSEANEAFADGPLTVMRFPESHINDMIFLEHRAHGLYLHHRRDVLYFSQLFATFMITALSPDESIRFLHDLL